MWYLREEIMHNTILRNIGIIIGVIIGLISIFVIGSLVYFRYFAFVPDKDGMKKTTSC